MVMHPFSVLIPYLVVANGRTLDIKNGVQKLFRTSRWREMSKHGLVPIETESILWTAKTSGNPYETCMMTDYRDIICNGSIELQEKGVLFKSATCLKDVDIDLSSVRFALPLVYFEDDDKSKIEIVHIHIVAKYSPIERINQKEE